METAKMYHIVIIHVTVITECLYASDMVRMCYFHASSRYRTRATFDSASIDFSLCTHYIYAYGIIDSSSNSIRLADPSRELGLSGAYSDFTTRYISTTNKPRRLLSLGGPNVTAHNAFVYLTQSNPNMRVFSRRAVGFLRLHKFGGLDIDWQYPNTDALRARLVNLLQILREDFDNETATEKLLLTVKCPGVYNFFFDASGIYRYADYVILAAYNLPGPNESQAWFGSPLYSQGVSVSSSLQEWIQWGLRVNKVVVGISAVGRFVKLANRDVFTPGSPIIKEVQTGYYYSIPNGLAYPEVCDMMAHGVKYFDEDSQMHYLVVRETWIGYEDKTSIQVKIHWMKKLNIAGVMFAAIDQDDFNGTFCGEGRYPLLNFIKSESLQTSPLQTSANRFMTGSSPESPGNTLEITTRKFVPPADGAVVKSLHAVLSVALVFAAVIVLLAIAYLCMFKERQTHPTEEYVSGS